MEWPRMLNDELAASYIGLKKSYFDKIKSQLQKDYNFPKKHPILHKTDKKALDKWIDSTGGLVVDIKTEEEELLLKAEKMRNG